MIALLSYQGQKLIGMRVYLSKEHLKEDMERSPLLNIHYSTIQVQVYKVGCSWGAGNYPFPFGMSIEGEGVSLQEYLQQG